MKFLKKYGWYLAAAAAVLFFLRRAGLGYGIAGSGGSGLAPLPSNETPWWDDYVWPSTPAESQPWDMNQNSGGYSVWDDAYIP